MNYLIAVEGGEFTGKTTVVVPALSEAIKDKGYSVLVSREPGGSEEAEIMRKEIFEQLRKGIFPDEQAKLFNKARKIHIDKTIKPFLQAGDNKVVVLDRYLDSTRVYQGLEGNVPFETIFDLEKEHVGNLLPDITVLLHFAKDTLKESIRSRRTEALESRKEIDEVIPFDEVNVNKHLQRQEYYLKLPEISKNAGEDRTFVTIDASGSREDVARNAVDKVLPFINDVSLA